VRVAIIDFQRSGDNPLLPQRDDHLRVDLRRSVHFIIVFNSDPPAGDHLFGIIADNFVADIILIRTCTDVGENIFGVGDCYGIGVDIFTNNIAHRRHRFGIDIAKIG